MTGYNPLSYTVDGLVRGQETLRRDVENLKRYRAPVINFPEIEEEIAPDPLSLCSTPSGYSEKDFTGRTTETAGSIYGFHDLNTTNCRIDYHWPRNSTGEPTYARIDFSRDGQISEPDLTFDLSGTWQTGNFSWGSGSIGLGAPGSGDDQIIGPSMMIQFTGDDDILSAPDPKFVGIFTNAAGTTFATSYAVISPHTQTFTQQEFTDVPFHIWIEGSTGYVSDGTTTLSVALTGSFLGGWTRWESYHTGGGGAGSNDGGSGEGNQNAHGSIANIQAAGTLLEPYPVMVKDNGAIVGTRPALNFIEGANVTLTITDDDTNGEVDIEIAASGGGGGGGGGLLAVTAYDPASATAHNLTTTIALLHASATVTFTVPSSGNVLVRLTASAFASATANHVRCGVLESGSLVGNTAFVTQSGNLQAFDRAFLITGLTPGASKTYGFGVKSTTANAGQVYAGGIDGAAVIEVWEAP